MSHHPPHSLYAFNEPRCRVDHLGEDFLTNILNINARFPFFITRAFLPSLRGNSQSGPVEIIFIGSFAGDTAVPFVAPYAGSKALTKRVSRILDTDERVLSGSNLVFVYANVGEVQSAGLQVAASLNRPHSDDYARYLVESFGSGRKMVIPYPIHHIIYTIVTGMPAALCDYIVLARGRSLFRRMVEGKKGR